MHTTNTIGSKVSSRHFDFNVATNEFVAEMSMLDHGGIRVLGQLYADAADTGFVMVSARTGKEVEFVLKEEVRDADRDIRYWEFQPTHQAQFYNPELRGVRVIVLND